MSIGARLKEERVRLGFSQTDFSGLAGASKGAQLKWEKDEAAPNALALLEFRKAGADVNYILTGERSVPSLSVAGKILAGMGVKVDSQGKMVAASDTYVTGAFLAGLHGDQIKDFSETLSEISLPTSTRTRGQAMAIIDKYGVPAVDMVDLMQGVALDALTHRMSN